MVSGALTYVEADGCGEKTYTSGEAFVDPGQGHVHSAYNPGPGDGSRGDVLRRTGSRIAAHSGERPGLLAGR